jgi:hypothetical protein
MTEAPGGPPHEGADAIGDGAQPLCGQRRGKAGEVKLKCCGQKPVLGRTVGGAIPQQLAHLHGAVPRIPAPEAGERARRRVGHVGRLERGEQPLGQRVKIRVAAKTGPVHGRHRVVKRGLQRRPASITARAGRARATLACASARPARKDR